MTLSTPTLASFAVLAPLLLYAVWLFGRALQSRSWPTVQATVVASRVVKGGNASRPMIEFTYTIDGRQYTSRRRSVGPALSVTSSWAESIIAACPKGSTVVVAVDPGDPAYAVLRPGIQGAHLLTAAVAGFLIVGSVVMHGMVPS